MKAQRLNQIISVEKGIKNKAQERLTELYHTVQKPALFDGFNKKYRPLTDDGEQFPPEDKRVQVKGREIIKEALTCLRELFDVTIIKDTANCGAKADVTVGDKVILKDVPATYLLYLEKQLTDLHTAMSKMPVLDPAEEWAYDKNASLYRTEAVETGRTKKVQKALVLYPHSDKHPAQTQLVTEDLTIGYWATVKMSGAMALPDKEQLLARIEKLHHAVKFAREEANNAPVQDLSTAAIFDYLTGQA
jgi:hypothetical protein